MPAHTQTRRGVDKHGQTFVSWQHSAGFLGPEFSCLPVQGSPYRMASTAHQTRDQERNSPSRRAGCLPARSLASVLRRLERPVRSPSIESSLQHQTPSCFSAGPRIYTGLSCPAWAPVLCLSFPSVLEVFSFPHQGILDDPQMLCPLSESLSRKREDLHDNATRKGREIYCWLEPGSLLQPTQWCKVREPCTFIGCSISNISSGEWAQAGWLHVCKAILLVQTLNFPGDLLGGLLGAYWLAGLWWPVEGIWLPYPWEKLKLRPTLSSGRLSWC